MISLINAINSELILAIDLRESKVVRAFAGFRQNYKPLIIGSNDLSDPLILIPRVLKKIKLKKIYIADLDSIQNINCNFSLIVDILRKFPKINFLIDFGFDYPSTVHDFIKKLKKKKINNFSIVLGTEKIKKYNLKCYDYKVKFYLSLDILNNADEWIRFLKKSKFKPDLILMFLRNVGGRGIRLKFLKKIKNRLPGHKFFYAGGVKHVKQIKILRNAGVESVIVSTLVHKHLYS